MTESIKSLKEQHAAGTLLKHDFIRQAFDTHRCLFEYIEITRNTEVREIRITEKGVQFRIGAEDIWLYSPPEESRVVPIETMNFDSYEPEETHIMDLLVADASQILDVGANIGWYAVRFAKRSPKAKVHAFEPMPVSYSYLQRNIWANEVGDRVRTYNYGLSDVNDSLHFYIAPNSSVNASLQNVADAPDAETIVGFTYTLDQWCSNHQVQPDFIKCDVEGAELLVFKGGKETLLRNKPIVFAEMLRKWTKPFGYQPNDMLRFFENIGYCCYAVGPKGSRRIDEINELTLETNYVFLNLQEHRGSIKKLNNNLNGSI